jgi:hypothetical protein
VTRRAPVNSPNFISAQLINELLEAIAHLHTTGIYSLSNPSTPSQSRTHSRNTPLLLLVFQPAGDSGSTAEDGLRWHAGAQSVVLLLQATTHPLLLQSCSSYSEFEHRRRERESCSSYSEFQIWYVLHPSPSPSDPHCCRNMCKCCLIQCQYLFDSSVCGLLLVLSARGTASNPSACCVMQVLTASGLVGGSLHAGMLLLVSPALLVCMA